MATILPRPTVEVTETEGKTHVVIARDGKCRSYEVADSSTRGMIKDAVEKVIADVHTAEWLP